MVRGKTAEDSQEAGYVTDEAHSRVAAFVRGVVSQSIGWFLEAEDFIQEAWVTALENTEGFQGESEDEFVSWVCGIARNKYRNARRMHEVTRRQWLSGHEQSTFESFASTQKPPDLQLAQDEMHRQVYAAIEDALTTFEAALVELVIFQDCTVAEIASACRVSRKRIDRGLSRALRKLAQHVGTAAPELRDSG